MDSKKALQLASVASMIDQFNIPNIKILLDLGYKVDVVADFTNPGTITNERAEGLKHRLNEMGVRAIDIAIPRSLNPKAVLSAYKDVKKLITTEHYNLIHCHSPIGGVICRQAAKTERNKGTKVIYTAHGFHFYDGAPLKNWLVFYPIEKWMSRYTDVLITINKEDYKRASEEFHAKRTVYLPGIGIDINKYSDKSKRDVVRSVIGLNESDVLLLSVGELNENKNHTVVIKALGKMKAEGKLPDNVYYAIAGIGKMESELKTIAKELNLDSRVKLLGFRSDVADVYNAADVFVFPSFREGLSVALMEAMASGLPVICSSIRGNTDLIDEHGGFFFDSHKVRDTIDAINNVLKCNRASLGEYNEDRVKEFDEKRVKKYMQILYTCDCDV